MTITDYEAKRLELDAKMQELNHSESEKKMELSVAYQTECKRIQSKIGTLKKQQKQALQDYQNNKKWWHEKFRKEKMEITGKMHLLRIEYLTVNNIDSKEIRNTTTKTE